MCHNSHRLQLPCCSRYGCCWRGLFFILIIRSRTKSLETELALSHSFAICHKSWPILINSDDLRHCKAPLPLPGARGHLVYKRNRSLLCLTILGQFTTWASTHLNQWQCVSPLQSAFTTMGREGTRHSTTILPLSLFWIFEKDKAGYNSGAILRHSN